MSSISRKNQKRRVFVLEQKSEDYLGVFFPPRLFLDQIETWIFVLFHTEHFSRFPTV
jgi:hypothetical protein